MVCEDEDFLSFLSCFFNLHNNMQRSEVRNELLHFDKEQTPYLLLNPQRVFCVPLSSVLSGNFPSASTILVNYTDGFVVHDLWLDFRCIFVCNFSPLQKLNDIQSLTIGWHISKHVVLVRLPVLCLSLLVICHSDATEGKIGLEVLSLDAIHKSLESLVLWCWHPTWSTHGSQ